jgi:3-oxoacyl-[acyl-carrier protein] reductase
VIENVGSQYGKIDVLVNNAGVFLEKAFAELSAGDLDWMMNVNFKGAFLTALYSEPYLSKGGRIVNVGSIVAESTPGKGNTLYAASKSALQGFTRGLARDLGEKGITVNLVQPGPVDTEMNPADAPFADFVRSRMAIPKYGQPEDIAALVTFLASAEAGYITGSIMTIDGGFIA